MDLIQTLLSHAEEEPIGRTKLLAKSGMSFSLFDSYLTSLIEKEFLEERLKDEHKFYTTTEKGGFLLEDIDKVIKKLKK